MTALHRFARSVRGRITLAATVLVALTLALASLLLIRLVENDLLASAEAALDEALRERAEQLGLGEDFPLDQTFQTAEAEVDGRLVQLGLFTEEEEGLAFGQLLIDDEPAADLLLDTETGEIVEVLDPFTGLPLDDPELTEVLESLVFEVLDPATDEDGPVLVGAAPLDEIEESIAALRRALLTIVPVLVVAFGVLTWWLVGRALRPVVAISEQVDVISTSNLHRRVPVPDTADEVAEMAVVMNRMLDRLERGGERQRQFSADASHELRSPLATVRAAAEILSRRPTPERASELSAEIVAEVERMDDLIGDLLELARLDEHTGGRPPVTFDLAEVIRDELASDPVELRSPQSLQIRGAPRQLQRLVRNLVDNARRHAEHRVVVTLDTADGRARLAVDDDGAGVPEQHRELIFERFSRLDQARGRSQGGTGLGLALVASIVDQHGGTVTVQDSELGGARFEVELPLGLLGGEADEAATDGRAPRGPRARRIGG